MPSAPSTRTPWRPIATAGPSRWRWTARQHVLQPGDLEVGQEATGELVVKGEGGFTVALDPNLDDELRAEGMARELVNRIQRLRKDAGLRDHRPHRAGRRRPGGRPVPRPGPRELHRRRDAGGFGRLGEPDVCDGFEHERDTDIDGVAARIALRVAPGAA